MESIRRTVRSVLNKVHWLRRPLQKILWQHRAQRAYQHRSLVIPRLLEKYGVKASKNSGPKHIIFIVVDALRKDHLSLYGYERETTPFLKSLSKNAAVFENAVTPSPWTFPAVASLLTGLYPHNHGGTYPEDNAINYDRELPNKVRQDILTLPDLLGILGFESYFIAAITPAAMATTGWFKHSSVCLAGSDYHLKGLLRWLKKNRPKRSFIYFHIGDLHVPINIPVRYRHTFGRTANIPKLEQWQFQRDAQLGEPAFEQYRQNRGKLYDCALRFVDAQLAIFFKFLKRKQLLDSSLIFITADHGEEFWDHVEVERQLFYDPRGIAGISHGHNLFQELINVPLICIGSGVAPGRYSHDVSLVDLAPTVLELCGIGHKLALDGRNLFDCSDERFLISEAINYGHEKKAILQNNWKLIESQGDGVSLLFDLSKDPKEKHNLAKTNPEKLKELKTLLPKTQVKGDALKVDRDIEEQLRHLGYM